MVSSKKIGNFFHIGDILDYKSYILLYFGIVNLLGLLMMGIDKFRAKKDLFRIPESNLFLVAVIGGSVGSLLGMYAFRHKTRHIQFVIGIPAIILAQILLVLWFIFFSPFKVVVLM